MGDIETTSIYGDLGIYEGKDRLVAQGLDIPASMQRVYIANHSRAILDLLYRSLHRRGRVLNLTGATTTGLTPESRANGFSSRPPCLSRPSIQLPRMSYAAGLLMRHAR